MLLSRTSRKKEDEMVKQEEEVMEELRESMKKDINKLFKLILRDYVRSFTELGIIPSQNQYKEKWEEIILKHTKNTAKIFSKTLRNGLNKSIGFFETKSTSELEISLEDNKALNDVIAESLAVWLINNAEKATEEINNTTSKEISNATNSARRTLLEQKSTDKLEKKDIKIIEVKQEEEIGVLITDQQVSALAADVLEDRFEVREDIIAFNEIGKAQSEAKFQEALNLNKSNATIDSEPITGTIKKVWNAILDQKTRVAHAEADFFYHDNPIDINEPFIVDGEQLQYPRDPAGSPGNTINCRCQMMNIADI